MRPFHHYLPIAEKLFHDGFYVTGAGCEQSAPGATYPPRKHPALYQFTWAEGRIYPEFGIVLITEGKGVFESKEMGRRTLQAGQVILLFPGIWHRYRPDPGTGWTEKWIQFNGEFAHRLLDHGILSTTRRSCRHPTSPALKPRWTPS
ncbi:MAG: AraC family ligand binding domain-containing protein [Verrucomicrobiota bacterium]